MNLYASNGICRLGSRSLERGFFSDTQFSRLVYNGRIGAASRYLTQGPSAVPGPQQLMGDCDKTVLEVLQDKHPPVTTPTNEVLLTKEIPKPDTVLFQAITSAKTKVAT